MLSETRSPRRSDRTDRLRPRVSGLWVIGALLGAGAVAVWATAGPWKARARPVADAGSVPMHRVAPRDLTVTVVEQGTLESRENTQIKCRVRGENTIIWVIESGSIVQAGDELVRLDTLALEDDIAERTKQAHLTRSGAERAKADVARAELAIPEYLEGRYRVALMTLEKTLTVSRSNLLTAQNMLTHAETMAARGYVSDLELEEKRFAVTQASLSVGVTETQIKELKTFTKPMELETLRGALEAAKARYEAEAERSEMDAERRDLALAELDRCRIRAERGGLVIYPRARRWKRAPDIEEGATVHQDQVLLLMPDLMRMQVKVGMHESVVDRLKPGMTARITLPGRTMTGKVASVAPVTRPAGWWTGNVVKYDTLIELPPVDGLKPGMTAEVDIVLARYEQVLAVQVTAVVETAQGAFCWVQTDQGLERRTVTLGDSDKDFAVVLTGLQSGDLVALDALTSVDDAQSLALADEASAVMPNTGSLEVDDAK